MVKDIICLWTGDGSRFGEEYVHKLKSMIDRHTTNEHRFFCLSPQFIDGIDTIYLNDMLKLRSLNMVRMFDGYPQLSSHLVYFDLDTIIVDNIDHILSYDGDFGVMYDLGAGPPMFGGALMIWDQDKFTWIMDKFHPEVMDDPKSRRRADVWYGNLIQKKGFKVDWFQKKFPDQLHSYKINLKSGDLLPTTKIVFFHGVPLPHEVDNDWVEEHWR